MNIFAHDETIMMHHFFAREIKKNYTIMLQSTIKPGKVRWTTSESTMDSYAHYGYISEIHSGFLGTSRFKGVTPIIMPGYQRVFYFLYYSYFSRKVSNPPFLHITVHILILRACRLLNLSSTRLFIALSRSNAISWCAITLISLQGRRVISDLIIADTSITVGANKAMELLSKVMLS